MVLTQPAIIALVLTCLAGVLAIFFAFLDTRNRQPHTLLWAGGWLLLAARALVLFFSWPALGWQRAVADWLLVLAVLAFWMAARLYSEAVVPVRWFGAAAVLAGFWAVANQRHLLELPLALSAAFLLFLVARVFRRQSRKKGSGSDAWLAGALALWGLCVMAGAFQPWIRALAGMNLASVTLLAQVFVALMMVSSIYEDERRSVERNMLALSNLNLAAFSLAGGEIHQMLAQALDRVLNVIHLPTGALCLHYGDMHGPALMVASGISEKFCDATQAEGLDDYVVGMVARLGGLVVLRDLGRDAAWEALEREEAFRKMRKLMLDQGLRTVVGVSLQGKDRVFGAMLLGTTQSRHLSARNLRLLLALGHQIGMAVENGYLIQQTSRRSEELHTLNEIGRALSSTLEIDALFEKIHHEIDRLLEVRTFFIAFHDSRKNEIRFDLEAIDNVRQPKRTRPARNHLIEHIMRTGQPVMIPEHFQEELLRLGLEPEHEAGSFCGVPLVLYDRPIGVMAVYSAQERAFDPEHLEMLRVLASEAGIAMENARLFGEEQKKSRQLMLLNNISRHAISTLNPDEMLGQIAAALEDALTYDHLGIATLDYSAKELVVQAEAGRRRSALGRRIGLGQGLIGQVARSGDLAVVREGQHASSEMLLSDSVCSVGLPVSYAEQLLGVLYAESASPCDFLDEEIMVLRTVADLVASALHNARVFQKAQEQAITDGLTGVKTYRFLMEALSAEWKRSTRAGRPFSLVLMDLDRFKLVNDLYGHLDGDAVLRVVARILERNCRRSDVVARYGGDEFVVLMPETTVEQAQQLAGKWRAWIESDLLLRDKGVTASFGIASFPLHGTTPQELIQAADAGMYLSKDQGGNCVIAPDQCDSQAAPRKREAL